MWSNPPSSSKNGHSPWAWSLGMGMGSLGSLCGIGTNSARIFPDVPVAPIALGAQKVHWPTEVDNYGVMMRTKYGPFIVLKNYGANQKRKRAVVPPLIDLSILLDVARTSKPLSETLATADNLMGYTEWASRRLGPSVCSKQVAAAETIANRHGLPEALHVGAAAGTGHAWAFDESWISEYSREERLEAHHAATPVKAPCGEATKVRPEKVRDIPRKRASLPSAVRMAVWNKHFGREAGVGECYCCSEKIYQQAFECGHVLASAKGGSDAVDNLRPVCQLCNKSMSDDHMDDFMRIYFPHSIPLSNVEIVEQREKEPRVRLRAKRTGVTPMMID